MDSFYEEYPTMNAEAVLNESSDDDEREMSKENNDLVVNKKSFKKFNAVHVNDSKKQFTCEVIILVYILFVKYLKAEYSTDLWKDIYL